MVSTPTNTATAMFQKLIDYSIHHKLVVGVLTLALAAWGVACAPKNVAALTTLGAAYLQTGEPQAAERILRQAVALSPTASEAQLCLAALLAQRGEAHRAEGRRWYEAALRGGASRDGVLHTYYGVK